MNAKQPALTALLGDAAVQQALAEQIDPERFEALALAQGIALDPAAQPYIADSWPPAPWRPVRFVAGDAPAIEWLHFAGVKPAKPFYADSIREAAVRPFNRAFRIHTPLDRFIETAEAAMPSGLIFHMSRCGSTLLAQMLSAAPDLVALAEPDPFDELLQAPLPRAQHVAALRAMAAALGRGYRHYFLKTDSWHSLDLPLLAEAFPGVPWIFLYRDPLEVLASHARLPGRQTVPGVVPRLASLETGSHGLDHAAQILAHIGQAVIDHGVEKGGMLVHYRELPNALFTRILPHFGIPPSPADRALMAEAAQRDAKAPGTTFSPAPQAPSREAQAAARHLAPVYAELEAIRAASLPAAA